MKIFIIILSIFVMTIYLGCATPAQETDPQKSIPVRIAEVQTTNLVTPIRRSGVLSAQNETRLSFKINGFVKKVMVNEGEYVREGTVLATLDLSEINAQVEQARSAFYKAERDLKRIERLYQDNVATLEQKENTKTAYELAEANLQIALFNLKHARITAPADGRIMKRTIEENELVSPGMPAFLFAPRDREWIIRVGVSESEFLMLQLGDSAHVSFDSYPGSFFRARVTELPGSVDLQSGTFEIELTLESTQYTLLSGFIGMVKIFPSIQKQVFLIPVESLLEANRTSGTVFSWNEETKEIKKIAVQIVTLSEDHVAISSGLEQIDHVIAKGAHYVDEHSNVKVIY